MPDWEYLDPEECRKLRTARQKNGLKQKDLAELIGVSPSQFCRIENGHAKCSPEQRRKLKDELKPNSPSPIWPLRTRSGFVFGSPLPLNQPTDVVEPFVDEILGTLPPDMRPIAARLALEVLSRTIGEIAQRLRAYINEASD